jgi:hypothetical protein
MKRSGLATAGMALAAALVGTPALAQHGQEDLARAAQNPLANMVSIPFQNNTNFNTGPENGTQNVLNIQPVIPIDLTPDWNLITRTIVPVVTQPGVVPGQDSTTGFGDTLFSAFLSPARNEGTIWGVGPAVQFPTHGSDRLGNDRWGLGPAFVALRMHHGSPWVYGFLVNNVWSASGGDDPTYNKLTLQPFVNYNLPDGWYLTSSPVVTADWKAHGGDRWTVPIGGGVGKIVRLGRLPLNLQLGAYYNVERPTNGSDWSVRAQVQLLLPKSLF